MRKGSNTPLSLSMSRYTIITPIMAIRPRMKRSKVISLFIVPYFGLQMFLVSLFGDIAKVEIFFLIPCFKILNLMCNFA
jgi:hypothetical protein